MADKKVSELVEATSAVPADVFLVVQDGVSKKITKGNLDKKNHEVLSDTGVVSTTVELTLVDNTSGLLDELFLDLGSEGLTKTVAILTSSIPVVLSITGARGFTSISLNGTGSSVSAIFTNGYWFILSSYNVTIT